MFTVFTGNTKVEEEGLENGALHFGDAQKLLVA